MKRGIIKAKRSRRGYSLTELAIVLGTIGIILSGIWALASYMRENERHARFSELMTTVVANIRGHYAGRAYFESTSAATMMGILKPMNVFPGNLVIPGNVGIDTSFQSNSLVVCGWPSSGQNACGSTVRTDVPLFAVEVTAPRRGDCVTIALRNGSPNLYPGMVAVFIRGVQQALPLSSTNVYQNCGDGAAIDFVFRLNP